MLTLTRKTDYALVALSHLDKIAPQASSARQIAANCQVPLPMLMNILKELMNAGLVSSRRGTKGGYTIARTPHLVSLADLILAVEGPVKLTACCTAPGEDAQEPCHLESRCPTRAPMQTVNSIFHEFLSRVTLQDILSDRVAAQFETPRRLIRLPMMPAVAVG